MDKIDKLYQEIKSLSIQGATDIAYAVMEGIQMAMVSGVTDFEKLQIIADRLAYCRPTEPLAQNAVLFILKEQNKTADFYLSKIEEYKSLISASKEKMAHFGASLIQNGGVYLTHCHSSTVVSMFQQAQKTGKRFSVFATETRPLFQGRKTVIELLETGIEDVTLIIDDVAESLLLGRAKSIDAVFIGADLLSQKGFVNKVGSLGLAHCAQSRKIPLYVSSILLKYDPRPYTPDMIEMRSNSEIWPNAPKNLSFYAPAFDFVPYRFGAKILCEEGLLENGEIEKKVYSRYPFFIKENGQSV